MQWNKTYIVGTGNSTADTLIKTNDGGFALTGFSSVSSWLIKTDSIGNQQLNTLLDGIGSIDSIIQTSDGGYAVTTESGRMIIEEGKIITDCTLTKIDSNGAQQWSQLYPDFGYGWSIVQTNDGGYVLGGGKGIALLGTDSFGVMQWNQSYGSGQAWAMTQTNDDGFALAGTALVKTDAAGNKQWALNFPDGAHAYTVIQTSDGGFLCAGQLLLGSATARTSWVAKTNSIPTQSPNPTSNPSPTPTISPSPSVPELSWLAILPLFAATLFIAVLFRRKT